MVKVNQKSNAIRPGALLTYTLYITNNGPSVANNVVVTDTLPGEVISNTIKSTEASCFNPLNLGNPIVCSFASIAPGTILEIGINVTVTQTAAGQLINAAGVSSDTQDPNPNNNLDMAYTTVDPVKPQVTWVSPVGDGKYYFAFSEIIHLVANPTDNLGVAGVHFYRWDTVSLDWVDIGYAYNSPYDWYLDTRILNSGWNEIDIVAYDTAGNVSERGYIFIWRSYPYLPLVIMK
jgi:uncharacterized repeat protein (TIGR01451 family)